MPRDLTLQQNILTVIAVMNYTEMEAKVCDTIPKLRSPPILYRTIHTCMRNGFRLQSLMISRSEKLQTMSLGVPQPH